MRDSNVHNSFEDPLEPMLYTAEVEPQGRGLARLEWPNPKHCCYQQQQCCSCNCNSLKHSATSSLLCWPIIA